MRSNQLSYAPGVDKIIAEIICFRKFSPSCLGGRENVPRVDDRGSGTNFKMQMSTAGVAGGSCRPDNLTLGHIVAALDEDRAQVGIEGLEAGAMVDHDHVAVTIAVRACIHDDAAIGGIDIVAELGSQVNCQMVRLRRVIDSRRDNAGR